MKIRIGYELIYDCPQPTPMILTLSVHYSRVSNIIVPDHLIADPPVPLTAYRDSFGNWCGRIVAPQGQVRLSTDALVRDTGLPDPVVPHARQTPVEELPDETLLFLLGSRYCETDRLSETAWHLFGKSPTGWGRVQAICDYVHQHIVFGYENARPTKTAYEAFHERTGVCRDFAHLAIAFCRCMNIPPHGIAPVTSATSACGRHTARWISAVGSRPILTASGTLLMPATISRALDVC